VQGHVGVREGDESWLINPRVRPLRCDPPHFWSTNRDKQSGILTEQPRRSEEIAKGQITDLVSAQQSEKASAQQQIKWSIFHATAMLNKARTI
jgi:hypothetical protein